MRILLLILILAPPVQALLQIQEVNQTDPLESGQAQTITIRLISDTNITAALIEQEGQNHTMQLQIQQGTAYTYAYSWPPHSLGENQYLIRIRNSVSEEETHAGQFTLQDTTPPQITGYGPNGAINQNPTELKITTDENTTCKYDTVDLTYESMRNTLPGTGTSHIELKNHADGSYTYYAKCQDPSQNQAPTRQITFTLDTSPPQITSQTPTGTTTQPSQQLRITTNEPANCKWDTQYRNYPDLTNPFQTTDSTVHTHAIILTEGVNTYYVACQDTTGNQNNPITITAELNTPPKAKIDLENPAGQDGYHYKKLRSGTYNLTLTATEPLLNPPSLSLKCGTSQYSIPLQGGGQNWNGYLLIPEGTMTCAAEFQYQGTDQQGMAGTEITEGKIVVIDTRAPSPPTQIKLTNEDNRIRVTWVPDEDELSMIDHYRIFRSMTGNTDQNDIKYATTDTIWTDAYVKDKTGYFYRISAVSQAGVESVLSEEEFLMTKYENITTFTQDPVILERIETQLAELEETVQTIDLRRKEYSQTEDERLQEIVGQKQLRTQLDASKSQVQQLIGEFKNYINAELTLEEMVQKIQIAQAKLKEIKKGIPAGIVIKDKLSREQEPDENIILAATEEYLKTRQFTADQRERYDQAITKLKDQIRVTQHVTTYDLFYESGKLENGVIVKEGLVLPQNLPRGILMQEIIPKDTLKLSETRFSIQPRDINIQGPLWSLASFPGPELVYLQEEAVEPSRLQQIQTVMMLDADTFLTDLAQEQAKESEDGTGGSSDRITGEAVAKTDSEGNRLFYAGALLGLFAVTLLGYYLFSLRHPDETPAPSGSGERVAGAGGTVSSSPIMENFIDVSHQDDYNKGMFLISRAREELRREDIVSAQNMYVEALGLYNEGKLGWLGSFRLKLALNTLYDELLRRYEDASLR